MVLLLHRNAEVFESVVKMLKIIIVDDDINVAQCLDAFISWQEIGYEVIGRASNGKEALDFVAQNPPDVIITDLKMPVMDGTEFCRQVCEMTDDISIIFLSAYEDFTTAQMALKYNVTEYILKPINAQKIQTLINVLRELAANYENRNFFGNLLSDKEKKKEIADHLEKQDKEWLQSLFDKLAACTAGKFFMIREICFMLIDVMYEYLAKVGVDSDIVIKKQEKSISELKCLHMKMDMITYVSQMYFDVIQFIGKRGEDSNFFIIEDVKNYILENYANPLFGVSDVADRFHFSSDYISRLFNKYVGMAINPYITNVRMQGAMKMLSETEEPLKNIAEKVGYSNLNYFIRVFRKQTNMTPSEYKTLVKSMNREVKEL